MTKRIRLGSLIIDLFVILLCLFLAGGGFYLFWQDLNASTLREDRESVAQITFKYKVAQRKFEDRTVWERLSLNSPLYDGDIIRTDESSAATIHFEDGSELNLYSNTMVQIFYDEEKGLQIAVDGGDIHLDSSSGTQAVSVKLDDGSVVNVSGGASLSSKADSSGLRAVEVKNGSAQLVTETGEEAVLSVGQSVSIEQGGAIVKNPITVSSVPSDLRILNIAGEEKPVLLAWTKSADDNSAVTVQTSRTKDFSDILTQTVADSSYSFVPESGGVTYWRVFTADSSDRPAEGKITVQNVERISLTSPADSGQIAYRAEAPRVNFRWEGNAFAEYYRLTVSSSPDLRDNVKIYTTSDTYKIVDDLSDGLWYWNVSPYYSISNTGFAGESQVLSFTIVQNQVVPAPSLSIPSDGASLTYWQGKDLEATFIWKSDIKDATYTVELASDSSFSRTIFTEEVTGTRLSKSFSNAELGDGTYWWRVTRHSSDAGDITPVSDARSFTVSLYIPQENKLVFPQDGSQFEKSALSSSRFMWKLGDDYKDSSSIIQISRNQAFSSVVMERTVQSTLTDGIELDEGTYYWRIGSRLSDGSTVGFTQPWKFSVVGELATPLIISPAAGAEVIAISSAQTDFRWNEVNGATSYSIKIYDSDENLIAQNSNLTQASASFALSEGRYTVRVQAADSSGKVTAGKTRYSTVANRSFTVRSPDRLKLSYPAQNSQIAGLTALRTQTEFAWEAGLDKPRSYNFVLSRQNADGSWRTVQNQTLQGTSYRVPRLTSGTYSWKVLAQSTAGYAIDSEERIFTVTAVPALATPRVQSPSNNTVLGSQYFKANRSIQFAWREVSGANSYTFTLYQRASDGNLTQIYTARNLRTTSVTYSELEKLDVGTFVWQVTAYSYAGDGYEEQRSSPSSSQFRIDFDLPQEVQTVDPGTLYGE